MPPRRGGGKNVPNAWAAAEVTVVLDCLKSKDFLATHAPDLAESPPSFPSITVQEACQRDSWQNQLCVAVARAVQARTGEHNNQQVRPLGSVALKLGQMRKHALARTSDERAALDEFDVASFMTAATDAKPSDGAAAAAAASSPASASAAAAPASAAAPTAAAPASDEAAKEGGSTAPDGLLNESAATPSAKLAAACLCSPH